MFYQPSEQGLLLLSCPCGLNSFSEILKATGAPFSLLPGARVGYLWYSLRSISILD